MEPVFHRLFLGHNLLNSDLGGDHLSILVHLEDTMKNFMAGFLIALILGISFGYFWAYKALNATYEFRLEQKNTIIDHYRNHWMPIREARKK